MWRKKHRKNCECCPVSLLIVRSQWLSWSQVLDCLKCKQFHTPCHVSVMVSVFVFSFVFVIGWVIVFWLVRSYIIITYVSKVTSLEDRSLNVFSKCICLCICIYLCHCIFFGQVIFHHHYDHMSENSKKKIQNQLCWLMHYKLHTLYVGNSKEGNLCYLLQPVP